MSREGLCAWKLLPMSDEEEPSFFADFAGSASPVPPPRRLTTSSRSSLPPPSEDAEEDQSFFQSFSPKTAAELRRYAASRSAGSIIESMDEKARLPDKQDSAAVKPNAFGKTVVARVRPFNPEEASSRAKRIVAVTPGHRLTLINPHLCQEDPDRVASILSPTTANETAKVFQFSRCLWSFDAEDPSPERMYMDQEGVYEAVGKDMVEYAVKVRSLNPLTGIFLLFCRGYLYAVLPMAIQARARHIPCLEVGLLTSMASLSQPRKSA